MPGSKSAKNISHLCNEHPELDEPGNCSTRRNMNSKVPEVTIHQLSPAFIHADAISNQAAYIRATLREWGYKSQVYAQFCDASMSEPGLSHTLLSGTRNDILIYHYAIGSPLNKVVRNWPGRLVIYYHNITPAHFLQDYNPEMALVLEQGRRELAGFKQAHYALAASEYNKQELLELGYQDVEVLPYSIYFDDLLKSAHSPAGCRITQEYDQDGWVNILFVGRIVPNKRQDDLIRAFHYYHAYINPRSRLFLVGATNNAPSYHLELELLAAMHGLEDVFFTGPVGLQEGLGSYFRAADVFLCLSEHEGFCVPLLEAMSFDVPVIAYRATGVPYTMGDAGIMIKEKRYEVIGELIDLIVNDSDLRDQIVAKQRERLKDFAPQAITDQLRAHITKIVNL